MGEQQSEPTAGETLGALSHALDLVEGQPRGHAERTWMVAHRAAKELGLGEADSESLFYACLLKDSGCSTNSARLQQVFGGDETVAKRKVKFVNWSSPAASALYAVRAVAPGGTFGEKLRRLLAMAGKPTNLMDEVTADRCDRGAEIARTLGFGEDAALAIRNLDEHWDGSGSPDHRQKEEIPLLGRIACLAQTMEAFAASYGVDSAYRVVRQRAGKWFDPEIVRAVCSFEEDQAFWAGHARHVAGEAVDLSPPSGALSRRAGDTDRICRAFASVVDAKSSFTSEHSSRVASFAVGIAALVGLPAPELLMLQRAGLLHDVGKLGVPNSILDKPGKLDEQEFARVRQHPKHSWEILSRIPAFARVAELSANHHERLDGRGYWRGLSGDQIDLACRCLTAADVYDALTAKRPYRDPMSPEEAMAIMRKDEGKAFDPRCLEALATLEGVPTACAA